MVERREVGEEVCVGEGGVVLRSLRAVHTRSDEAVY